MPEDFNPKGRFSDRVDYYVKYRPRYPAVAIEFFIEQAAIEAPQRIADVGSGTGILSEALLQRGFTVLGIEPNAAMRRAAEDHLRGYDQFISSDTSAEKTGLDSASVDAITCGQSFHWFDLPPTKAEFKRILKPGGMVGLLWNNWQNADDPLAVAYRALMTSFGIDYNKTHHTRVGEADFNAFFKTFERTTFPNPLHYNLDGLKGRSLSSSYVPLPGHPNYAAMMAGLEALFAEFQQDAQVTFLYEAEVYWGTL
jgi:SAM-dependent methyltransferase